MNKTHTPAEVAAAFQVGRTTVYRWIRSGDLPARRRGRRYLIQDDDLHSFFARVRERMTAPAAKKPSFADFAGVIEGPGDLSYHPRHMEGFGE
ncbi:helix-turn-helix domain-containing protein [bacterium]|nr:helix-turn-helix domain-containing protein [bacterium]